MLRGPLKIDDSRLARESAIRSCFVPRQRFGSRICSSEHESAIPPSLGAHVAQANQETSAVGAEPMEPTHKTLKAAFESIRDTATKALSQIEQLQEDHSTRWKCKQCRYIKHFTTPVLLETAGRCPRCDFQLTVEPFSLSRSFYRISSC